MAKQDIRKIKSNFDMAYSLAILADNADVPMTVIPQNGNDNYQEVAPEKTLDTDVYLVDGLNHSYLLNPRQEDELYANTPFTSAVRLADSEKMVKGMLAFEDIYRKMEIDADTNQPAVMDVSHVPNHLFDEENLCYDASCKDGIDCIAKQPNKITKVPIAFMDNGRVIMEYDNGK